MSNNEQRSDINQSLPIVGKVASVATTLRTYEDHNLAHRLQEEEFGQHYDMNRHERRLVGGDTKKSKEQQQLEDQFAAEYRAQLRRDIEKEDERIARQLQQQLEIDEQRKLADLAKYDQELARRLELAEAEQQLNSRHNNVVDDERLARQLQQKYQQTTGNVNRRSATTDVSRSTTVNDRLNNDFSDEMRQNQMNMDRLPSQSRSSSSPTVFQQSNSIINPSTSLDRSSSHSVLQPTVGNLIDFDSDQSFPPPPPPIIGASSVLSIRPPPPTSDLLPTSSFPMYPPPPPPLTHSLSFCPPPPPPPPSLFDSTNPFAADLLQQQQQQQSSTIGFRDWTNPSPSVPMNIYNSDPSTYHVGANPSYLVPSSISNPGYYTSLPYSQRQL